MNYQQTLEYLFQKLPMFSRVGSTALRKDLTNTLALCEAIGNPQNKFKSVHIGGTNGKGSTSHMLAAILQSAGYTTGLYTSPHLKDFRERIRINGDMISEPEVVEFTARIQPSIDQLEPSFFEVTVAMAFDHFARHQVDIAVIEVGLGGRLDSTNVIHPEVSVITNIGLDHMNILGDTVQEIAGEKAGIIKKGVPVVVGETTAETSPVFKSTALSSEAPIVFADSVRFIPEWKQDRSYLIAQVEDSLRKQRFTYQLDLTGYYQLKNLVTVLEAVHQLKLRGWNISDEAVEQGLKHVKKITGFSGRWDVLGRNPMIVADVAHNPDGISLVLRHVETLDYNRLHIIIGMVHDKDYSSVLSLLPEEARYYFTKAQIPRALDETQLQEAAAAFELKGDSYPDVNAALHTALASAGERDLILICGSVFLIGELHYQR